MRLNFTKIYFTQINNLDTNLPIHCDTTMTLMYMDERGMRVLVPLYAEGLLNSVIWNLHYGKQNNPSLG